MSKNLQDVYSGIIKNDINRRENDLYETPPLATYILHKYSQLPKNIIEPCAGRGNISLELMRNGYNVKSYDLNSYNNSHISNIIIGQNVLELSKQTGYDGFITNPPYFNDLPRKIAEKGIEEYQYTALFVRLTFLEGMKRKKMFDKNPPSQIIILSDRVKFQPNMIYEPIEEKEQIGGMICYCWVIWDKDKTDQKIDWVSLKENYKEWKLNYDKWKNE